MRWSSCRRSSVELEQRLFVLRLIGDATVPPVVVLHEAHAATLGRPGEDDRRGRMHLIRPLEGIEDLSDVVAVYLLDMPAEGAPLVFQTVERHDVTRRSGLLD